MRPQNQRCMTPQEAAERSISALGCGFDLADDINLSRCRRGPGGARLVQLGDEGAGDLVLPGGVVVRGVPSSVRCDKGERIRFRSDVLPFHLVRLSMTPPLRNRSSDLSSSTPRSDQFCGLLFPIILGVLAIILQIPPDLHSSDRFASQQMSEQFNRGLSLSGKIPSGMFNAAFDFRGCWLKDAAETMSLSFDGWFIALYSLVLERHHFELLDHVKQAVPPSWDPAALARQAFPPLRDSLCLQIFNWS